MQATPSLDELGKWIGEYIEGSNNPDLRAYGSVVLSSLGTGRHTWFIKYMMDLGRMYDCRVLDIGCGFGWDSVILALLGNNRVVANDIRDTMIEPLKERVSALRQKGAPLEIETVTGNICTLSLEPESFDAVFCNEAIEHIHDLDAMFRRCAAILKPGGRCVVANDNNSLDRKNVATIRNMWQRRDRSWDYIEELKRDRPIENRDILPYAVMREQIVRQADPSLGEEAVAAIVDATAGLTQPDIERVAQDYASQTQLPTPPAYAWCRNPVTGEFCERLLNPFEIAECMTRHGFKTRVFHAFRKWPLRLANRIGVRALQTVLFNLRRLFVIQAIKP